MVPFFSEPFATPSFRVFALSTPDNKAELPIFVTQTEWARVGDNLVNLWHVQQPRRSPMVKNADNVIITAILPVGLGSRLRCLTTLGYQIPSARWQ